MATGASRWHTRRNGRVVDTAGDSVLAIFETAIGAVTAALEVQVSLEKSTRAALREKLMLFRIVQKASCFETRTTALEPLPFCA